MAQAATMQNVSVFWEDFLHTYCVYGYMPSLAHLEVKLSEREGNHSSAEDEMQ
jgi:hypothetical protein